MQAIDNGRKKRIDFALKKAQSLRHHILERLIFTCEYYIGSEKNIFTQLIDYRIHTLTLEVLQSTHLVACKISLKQMETREQGWSHSLTPEPSCDYLCAEKPLGFGA